MKSQLRMMSGPVIPQRFIAMWIPDGRGAVVRHHRPTPNCPGQVIRRSAGSIPDILTPR